MLFRSEKKKFVAMTDSYHGDTLGSVSVGGIALYKKVFEPLVFETIEVPAPYCYRCPEGCEKGECAIDCIEYVEKTFKNHHNEIAAMIVEPLIQGAAGMRMYPPEYLAKIRELCDKYDILMIDDEVAMGFWRTVAKNRKTPNMNFPVWFEDRKSTRLNSSHTDSSRMPSSA